MKKSILILVLLTVGLYVFSQKSKIKDLENQRKKALIEIENTNKLLIDTKKVTANLLNRIKLISSQINSRQQVISLLNEEIEAINKEHKETEKEIERLESELKQKQENYAIAIKGMIRTKQNKNKLLFVLSGKSLGESLRRMRYLKDYSDWRNQQAEEIREDSHKLSERKLALEKSKKEKLDLLAERRAEQNKLKETEKAQQTEAEEAKKNQKQLQAMLKQQQKQADALNAQIKKLIAEEVKRQEKEAKRIAAEKAKASGKSLADTPPELLTATKENIELSNNFVSNKGKLPMPVTGKYRIINKFGTHHHKQWNVTTNSDGIDILTQEGADAYSIFKGEVTTVGSFSGYSNYIIVRHGGYYTFYGNIQQVAVKMGQEIKTGERLGRIYTDADNGRSQLHFQLWKGTSILNPENWLRR